MVAIKLWRGQEVRRVAFDGANPSLRSLRALVRRLFSIPPNVPFLLRHPPNGRTLREDDDLRAAIAASGPSPLTLRLVAAPPAAFSPLQAPPRWSRISSPLAAAARSYDAVVVGSGYGGAIAALRLAALGLRVCILERGHERLPGEYPSDLTRIVANTQLHKGGERLTGRASSFFDLRVEDRTFVWVGCGLGGGSLVNSNVAIRPDDRIFDLFPPKFKSDPARIERAFDAAFEMLAPLPTPGGESLGKTRALARGVEGTDVARFGCARVNVTFSARVNPQGVAQPACTFCGDCNTGGFVFILTSSLNFIAQKCRVQRRR
jgi:hypothetical protein